MERLTTRNIAGVAVYKHPFECERCGDEIWRLPDCGNGSPTEKLANYEGLEEQELLLRLPCKVETYVYYILGIPNKTPCTINSCTFKLSDVHKIGKSLFLTSEEAETKLKELEGRKDGK